jgi:hypothetical protein
MRSVAAFLLLISVAAPATAQTSPEQIVSMLASARQEDRAAGVRAALAIPPEARGKALPLALDREFIRYVGAEVTARRPPATDAARGHSTPPKATRGAKGTSAAPATDAGYLPSLLEAVSASTNPDIVPALIEVADSGSLATDALARFGDAAVPGLVADVKAPVRDSQLAGVLTALRTMTESSTALSPANHQAIVELVAAILDRKLLPKSPLRDFTAALAIEIGVAIGDPGLRKIAEAVATNATEAQHRAVSQDGVWLLQQRARDALARHPAKTGAH